jgi:aminoglycoside phosphotransferase (APT) family kinase protein
MKVSVIDPFGVSGDREFPMVRLALDPVVVRKEFKRRLPRLAGEEGLVQLNAIRVTRHKPGRRCVVEYDVCVERPEAPPEPVTLVGKARARRYGKADYRLLDAIWHAGFQSGSPDGVSVPEPIGVVPHFQMWLQRKVPGELSASALLKPEGVTLAARIAEAAHKLHRASIRTGRRHGMQDELGILHKHLPSVVRARPEWAARLERILAASDRLGAAVGEPRCCGIHRDFYSAQVIVDKARVWLLDFDLYCQGDPALDIGNFLGHITEQGLRLFGDAGALADREKAMEDRFVELSGEATRPAVHAYTTLTLVRHIYLSTLFSERAGSTERLIQLCEERLGLPAKP